MDKPLRIRDLPPNAENILDLTDPQTYNCHVELYVPGHSILIIRASPKSITDTQQTIYVCFEAVRYFEGGMHWTGFNLCAAPVQEFFDLLQRLQYPPHHAEPIDVNEIDLSGVSSELFFIKTTSAIDIKISAAALTILDKMPELL